MTDTNTARCPVADCLADAGDTDGLAEHLYDAHSARQLAATLAKARARALTEAAELIRQHRGDINTDLPWWDTRDRETAIRLLLAARTTTALEQQ